MSGPANKPLSRAALRDLALLGAFAMPEGDDQLPRAFASLPGPAQEAIELWLAALERGSVLPSEPGGPLGQAIGAIAATEVVAAAEIWRRDLKQSARADENTGKGGSLTTQLDAIDDLVGHFLARVVSATQRAFDEKLERHSRLITVGQVTASIGHDLRNPLGVIESSLFILRHRPYIDDTTARHLDKIERQVSTCNQIIADLLSLAKDELPHFSYVDPADLFTAALREAGVEQPGLRLETHSPTDLRFAAAPGLITRALVNLVANSARAIAGRDGTIRLEATPSEGAIEIAVTDSGPGFPPELLERAFEPLVTTHDDGVGLGLALVGAIAQRHGGHARARNCEGGGATVVITIPRRSQDAGASDPT